MENGDVTITEDTATTTCEFGYLLTGGDGERSCLGRDGVWSGTQPTCTSKCKVNTKSTKLQFFGSVILRSGDVNKRRDDKNNCVFKSSSSMCNYIARQTNHMHSGCNISLD